jgi:hypothetical protein
MSNIRAVDKDSFLIEIAADGTGTGGDPFVPHHKVVNSVLPSGAATESTLSSILTGIANLLAELQLKVNLDEIQLIGGVVAVNNFPTNQVVSGTIGVNNFPAIQVVADNPITTTESIFPLSANGTFTGSIRDGLNKTLVRGWVFTDKNGTLNLEQSINQSTWRQTNTFSIPGDATKATIFSFQLVARYYRFRYVNGGGAQTTFDFISTNFGIV